MARQLIDNDPLHAAFEDTYSSHGVVLVRSAVEASLAMAVMRCCQSRRDSHGLGYFFDLLAKDGARNELDEGVYAFRLDWVDEPQARAETDDRMVMVDEVRKDFTALRGRHEYARTKAFRDKFIAHRTLDVTGVELPERGYVYLVSEQVTDLVSRLSCAVLANAPCFDVLSDNWSMYSTKLVEAMIQGVGEDS